LTPNHGGPIMKTLKVMTVAGILAIAPGLAMAGCSDKHQQAQTCISGSTWDSSTQTCVPIASS
jgi:hypothetical protein